MKHNNTAAVVRRVVAGFVLLAVTLLFLDFSGALHAWLGWLAKIQLLPAVLAANFAVIAAIAVITLLFGRVYCSVICPLGIFQDGVSWLSGLRKKGRERLRFSWSAEKKWLRYGVFAIFILALIFGIHALVALLAPYSAYGRIVTNLFQPVWRWGNNLLAAIAEHYDSYAFYTKDVWLKSLPTFIVAAVTFIVLGVLAWKNGRTYCNTVCPVGTALSFLSRFAAFRPTIDASKCKNCHLCEKGCKAACIDIDNHKIDYSRCVDCFDCLGSCNFDALHYRFAWNSPKESKGTGESAGAVPPEARATLGIVTEAKPRGASLANASEVRTRKGSQRLTGGTVSEADGGVERSETAEEAAAPADSGRRAFLASTAILAGTLALDAQDKKVDGGLAAIKEKKEPPRQGRLVPFGAQSPEHFYSRCTACGLCIAACPNEVLRPSSDLQHLMQPYMSFEKGYCRPECTECSQVCPAGAILPITPEEKTGIHIGIASVNYDLCVVNRDGVDCGNCARHCPVDAIHMVAKDPDNPGSPLIPSVDSSLCIGCGACENLCPARPYSAIHVDGRLKHIQL